MSSSLRCGKEQGYFMLLFYSFFDERAGITGSKAVEEVGRLRAQPTTLHRFRIRTNLDPPRMKRVGV